MSGKPRPGARKRLIVENRSELGAVHSTRRAKVRDANSERGECQEDSSENAKVNGWMIDIHRGRDGTGIALPVKR